MPEPSLEPHILTVEDDGETRRLLVRLLRENGYRTTGVADGEAMWQALEAGRPDLILLDLMLPRRPGLTLPRELRADARWAALPVVIVTARGQVVDRTRGLELGADDDVTKPFEGRELLARIAAVLRRSLGRAEPTRPGPIRFSERDEVASVAPASTSAPQLLAHTDWLYHHLDIEGPVAELAAFRAGAAGSGTVPGPSISTSWRKMRSTPWPVRAR